MQTKKSVKLVFIAIFGMMVSVAGLASAQTNTVDDPLIEALIHVESHGKDDAVGDRQMKEKAYGCLQIRKPCVDDVNRRFGTQIKVESLVGNRSLSVWVCKKYIEMYAARDRLGREPTMEDMARIWNGGPNGWKKESTRPYWAKVERALDRTAQARLLAVAR